MVGRPEFVEFFCGEQYRAMTVNVVVPLDGSALAERALDCGRSLAAKLGGELVVVGSAIDDDDEYTDLAAYLNGLELPRQSSREMLVRVGAAKAIDTIARRMAPCLVCMSARGRGARAAAVLGSVTAQVLAQGAAPVLVTGPEVSWSAGTKCDSLLVCVDDTPQSVLAVEPATLLAAEFGVAVHYVTVIERPTEIDGVRDAITERLTNSGLALPEVEVLVAGDAAAALVRRAKMRPGTVLVMATHGRTRTQKLVLGSVTSSVVRRADGPVLAVPPHRAATTWRDWRQG